MTNDQECFGFDPFKLTTSERRIFIDKMNCYLAYFQKMQEKAENRNVIDRVVKKVKFKETRKQKEKELERLQKCNKLVSRAYEKIRVNLNDNNNSSKTYSTNILTLSGAAATNKTLTNVGGGPLTVGGCGMAPGTIMGSLISSGIVAFESITEMSDKQQAISYKLMCETLLRIVNAYSIPKEVIKQPSTLKGTRRILSTFLKNPYKREDGHIY